MRRVLVVSVLLFASLTACAAIRSDLERAERSYEQARYDEAIVWLRDLEGDTPDMTEDVRARFYFLRGMTAMRLQQRDDALYFLALAREVSGEEGTGLREEWRTMLERALTELTPEGPNYTARGPNE